MKVAPYIWFKCPTTGKNVVDQVLLTSDPLPSTFDLDCDERFGGCGKTHKNDQVKVVAIGRYLALKKRSKFYDEQMVKDFNVFLKHYGCENIPTHLPLVSKEVRSK